MTFLHTIWNTLKKSIRAMKFFAVSFFFKRTKKYLSVWRSYSLRIPNILFFARQSLTAFSHLLLRHKQSFLTNVKKYPRAVISLFRKDSTSLLRRALYLTRGTNALIITPRKIIIQTLNPLPSSQKCARIRKRFFYSIKNSFSFLLLLASLFKKDVIFIARLPVVFVEKILFSGIILVLLELFFFTKTIFTASINGVRSLIATIRSGIQRSFSFFKNAYSHISSLPPIHIPIPSFHIKLPHVSFKKKIIVYLEKHFQRPILTLLSFIYICEKTLNLFLSDIENLTLLIKNTKRLIVHISRSAYKKILRYFSDSITRYIQYVYRLTCRDITFIISFGISSISFIFSIVYKTLEDFYAVLSSVRHIVPVSRIAYTKSPALITSSLVSLSKESMRHIFYPFLFLFKKGEDSLFAICDSLSDVFFIAKRQLDTIPLTLSTFNTHSEAQLHSSSFSSSLPPKKPEKQSRFSFFKKHYLGETLTLAIVLGTVGVFMSLYAAPTRATFPLAYQGKLMDQNYVPKADTSYFLAFEIYDASTNGTCKWQTETGGSGVCDGTRRALSVTTNRGLFTALLGDGTTNNPAMGENFNTASSAYYLQVRVCTTADATSGCETLTPRKQLSGSVYAYTAHRIGGSAAAMSGTPALVGLYNSLTTGTFTDSNTAASGTATNMVYNSFDQGTLASTNATVTTTNAYTLYIAGAPAKGTNDTVANTIALGIAAGSVGAQTTSYGLYVNAQTGATTNYAGVFSGGIVGIGTATPDSLLDISNTSIASTQPITMITNETDTTTLDPLLQFRTGATPTVNWTLGNDDSDGDKFLIGTSTLNTNTMVTLDSRTTTDGVSAMLFGGLAPTISATSTSEYTTLTVTPPTITYTGTTQVTSQMDSILFNAPTITNSSSNTVDAAATLTIAGAPVKAGSVTLTNTYGLKINAAAVSTATNGYGLYVSAPTGATNNYGGVIASGRFGIGDTSPDALLDFDFTSTSTSATTEYGGNFTGSDTGVVTSGTDITYNIYNTLTRTGATGGTIDTYGEYITLTTDNAGSGTHRAWGLYVTLDGNADTNYGIYSSVSAAASQTTYGLYVDAGSGAGTEYAGVFTNGNVGIGNTAPTTLLTLGTAGTTAGTLSMAGSSSGVVTLAVAAAAGTWTLTLPTNDGDSGQYLQTNGSGVTSWATPTSITVLSTTNFENSNRFTTALTNGTATFNSGGVTFATTGTATSYIKLLWAVNTSASTTKLFSGSPQFTTRLTWKSSSTLVGSAFVGIGQVTTAGTGHTWTNNHIGFIFIGNGTTTSVYASQADGTTENRSSALTTIDGASNDALDLILKVNSTASVDYYWRKNADSLSSATNLTSNLPTANEDSIQFSAANDSTANNINFDVGSASYER